MTTNLLRSTCFVAAVWSANVACAQTMEGLGALCNAPASAYPYSYAQGVSADGKTVVGYSNNSQGYPEAFRWTAATGMQGLGTLPGGLFSRASAVSADGSTIVGQSDGGAF